MLRRLSTNVVDRYGDDGTYRRALETPRGVIVLEVAQPVTNRLTVVARGNAREKETQDAVARMLATDVDMQPFLRASRRVPWLRGIAARMRGVHPPRYPTLWEACVNAVVFQQISLFAAGAMMQRLVERFGTQVGRDTTHQWTFPSADNVASAEPAALRGAGLSAAKATALAGIAQALARGTLSREQLERRSSPEAAALLQQCRGIGPWTAAVILLRGLGRLDVFPENDSGAARSLALLLGHAGVATEKPVDVQAVLEQLGDTRGMLYYHLLLARLEARGEIPPPR